MKRIATPNRAVDLFGAGKDGYRSAVAGVSTATEFSAPWFNHMQEAIVRTIETAGLSLSDTDYDQFTNAIKQFAPAGKVAYFAMNSAPVGWLKVNGATVSRTTYAALFSAIGTTFGAGDGATTFALPDLRGEFLRGWDNGRGVDAARAFGTSQLDEFKSHIHGLSWHLDDGSGAVLPNNYPVLPNLYNPVATQSCSSAVSGGGGVETRPRNIALLACIKY